MVPMVYGVALLLPLLIFLIKSLYFNQPTTNTNKNLPPSPPKLPLIGNLHQLGPLLHRSLHSLSQKCGGGPLMLIHLGSVPTLVVSSAEAASEILKVQDITFSSRPDIKMWHLLFPGLKEVTVAPYGEYWRQAKSIMMLHLLSNKKVAEISDIREEEIAVTVEKIRDLSSKSRLVDVRELFETYTSDVVCRATFGRKYTEGESAERFKRMLKEFFEVLGGLNFEDLIPQLGWLDRLRGFYAKVERVAKDFDEVMDEVVEERLRKQAAAAAGGGDVREDFVGMLLQIQKDDKIGVNLDRQAIKALLMDAYVAGTDTSSVLLEWVFTELIKHPDMLKKVQHEVRTVLKGKQKITQDDIGNMKYMKAVVIETLRVHPPITTLVPRVASKDVKVMGYDVAKGTRVLINTWIIARDPKVWDDPNEFRPERFLECTIDFKGRDFNLLPFGSGRRGCPGSAFGMATVETLLANLLFKFDWELPNEGKEDDIDMNERTGFMTGKKVPLLVVAKPFYT